MILQPPKSQKLVIFGINLFQKTVYLLTRFLQKLARGRESQIRTLKPNFTVVAWKMWATKSYTLPLLKIKKDPVYAHTRSRLSQISHQTFKMASFFIHTMPAWSLLRHSTASSTMLCNERQLMAALGRTRLDLAYDTHDASCPIFDSQLD